tara:strand:- start:7598 stop:8239 length:642 start_codon:yes stop_codon:yes gene_type:complete
MEKFVTVKSTVAPLNRANVDTDAIIPKQFLKSIERVGFGPYLFDEWRYLDHGEPGMDCTNRPINESFVLNQEAYKSSKVLLTRANFGCGSSREHAPWALQDYGFRVIIAPSFADIFFNNCFKNGILPIVLAEDVVNTLFDECKEGYELTVDLAAQTITKPNGDSIEFDVDPFRKHCLLNGLDDIGITLQDEAMIHSFEEKRRVERPWLFADIK